MHGAWWGGGGGGGRAHRSISDVEVTLIQPPRPGKKLLVFDLDHTLYDCGKESRAAAGHEISLLKRPYVSGGPAAAPGPSIIIAHALHTPCTTRVASAAPQRPNVHLEVVP
eukprot:COSAG01_NODE_13961_length_1513_cov_133.034653_2_plen_111_part_00